MTRRSKSSSFKDIENFDVLPYAPSDHHYINQTHPNIKTQTSKTINKEWKMLKQGLPSSIFVRAYESRTDLMRAAIIGPAGTPYSDGLFFFDISFPDNYPYNPPSLNFRSHGLRLNPNLYSRGYICLSLLNTWAGRSKEENWTPNKSTVLQVLVSIQGLVFNEYPFYNEPGVALNPEAAEKYNLSCFNKTCRLMIFTMKTPPIDFDKLVKRFFQDKAFDILSNSRAKIKDSRVVRSLFYDLAKLFEEEDMGLTAECRQVVDQVKEEELLENRRLGFLGKIWINVVDFFEGW